MRRSLMMLVLCCGPALSGEAPPTGGAAPRAADALQPAVNTSAPAARSPAAAAPAAAANAPKTTAGARSGSKDRIELDTTQITGNSELPRVLYVVPWKHSDLGDLTGKPANSLLDEVLAPVDRDVFRRQNSYYDALKPDTATRSATAVPEGEK